MAKEAGVLHSESNCAPLNVVLAVSDVTDPACALQCVAGVHCVHVQ